MKKHMKWLSAALVCVVLFSLCAPVLAAGAYRDVDGGEWYAEAANALRERGIMNGMENDSFGPDRTFTRAQLATVLYRMAGSPAVSGEDSFTDTDAGMWYSDAILWSEQNGIINGYGDGLYGTEDSTTQEQLAVMLWRDGGSYVVEGGGATEASTYAADAVRWLRAENLVNEAGPSFEPKKPASRAQVADIVYRYLLLKEKYADVDATSGATRNADAPGQDGTAGGKVLIAYFSRAGENYNVGVIDEGNTAKLAKEIAAQTGGTLFEIVPAAAYPSVYDEMLTVATRERENDERPGIGNTLANFAEYDTVFLGYPIWWGDLPMILHTFMESYDFTGKTVIPFNTHEGSGQSGTQSTIASKLSGATVLQGLAMRGSTAQALKCDGSDATVKNWLDSLGFAAATDEEPRREAAAFDFGTGTVLLNSGYPMPILGIGTYSLSDTQAENSVYWALKAGFRLIDTARIYGNESGVGRGIQRAIDEGFVEREDIFVTTKMWTSDYDDGAAAIDGSLRRLGLDYIDLMILHHSQPSNDVAAYKAMEKAVSDGKLRSIGLSNYYEPADFDRLVSAVAIRPALLQNETHPYHQSGEMKEHIAQYGTLLESWFPLGGRGNTQTLFNDSTISAIAAAHGKSPAQVIIRWHLQAGNICIPGSSNEKHITEDYDVWDFSLNDREMQQMAALDKNRRFADY